DILPFIPFDIGRTMDLLHRHHFIIRYEVGGKAYGFIPTFITHQRPHNNEAKSVIPEPPPEAHQYACGNPDIPDMPYEDVSQEGKGVLEQERVYGNGEWEREPEAAVAAETTAPLEPEPEPLTDPSATAHHALTVINTQG